MRRPADGWSRANREGRRATRARARTPCSCLKKMYAVPVAVNRSLRRAFRQRSSRAYLNIAGLDGDGTAPDAETEPALSCNDFRRGDLDQRHRVWKVIGALAVVERAED